MQEDIFRNAYFGKAYKTRDGRKAIFLDSYKVRIFGKDEPCIKCVIQDEDSFFFFEPDGLNFQGGYSADEDGDIEYWNTDIVSEWKDEVDEKKLDEIAEKSELKHIQIAKQYEALGQCYGFDYKDGFKDGYNKAKEE